MNPNKTLVLLMAALAAVLMLSACGNKSLSGAPQEQNTTTNTSGVSDQTSANSESGNNAAASDQQTGTNDNAADTTAARTLVYEGAGWAVFRACSV
ncbi:hypothetical protein POTG_01349 [Paenibacillus sp. oral taxon 786 str. D14]|uniref:hypothetical protein n=1 Tax=Paenibacillus sp. oral taxon 786 TaxID=652715 RepID=UPI0001AFCC62|nr:hypothetical protein [Paenibacillus sp. oral taxon 786]EES74299.1 hypothetical protein POTG_01349 [Paenibacillus sp. oral taxon 786 str. D14]